MSTYYKIDFLKGHNIEHKKILKTLIKSQPVQFLLPDLFLLGNSVIATIGDKIVEKLYSNSIYSENKRIHTPPLPPPFKVGVFVVFYR